MKINKLKICILFFALFQIQSSNSMDGLIKVVARTSVRFKIIPTLIFVLPAIKIVLNIMNKASQQPTEIHHHHYHSCDDDGSPIITPFGSTASLA